MPSTSLEEQIDTLRGMGKPWVGWMAQAMFVVPALILLYRALAFREYPLIVFAAFFGFFAGLVSQGMPHIRRAIAGIDTCDSTSGQAKTWTEEGSESVHHMLEVRVPGRGSWVFEYRPQHWEPKDEEMVVQCRFISHVRWPVLVLSDRGLMYPTHTPKALHD